MADRIDYSRVAPEGYKAFGGVYRYVQQCSLPRQLVDMVFLRVSLINGCAYCIDSHSRDLLETGMSADKLALIPVWREAKALFTEQECAALAWAERLTKVAEAGVPDEDYAAVTAVFNDREVADLTYAVCLMNGMNRLAISFHKTPMAVAALQA